MSQLTNLHAQLREQISRRIQDDRTTLLMSYESKRREYNRRNKENVDLYTFIHFEQGVFIEKKEAIKHIEFELYMMRTPLRYLRLAKYGNNKRVRVY